MGDSPRGITHFCVCFNPKYPKHLAMNREQCFNLGAITKPYGISGQLLLFIDADEPNSYQGLDGFFVEREGRLIPYFLQSMRPHGKRFVIALEGVTTLQAAQALASCKVYLPLDQLPELDDETFYFHEVQGWRCIDAQSLDELGTIQVVREDGPYPLLMIQSELNQEIIVPLPDHLMVRVNRKMQTLTVPLPPGLLDLYLNGGEEVDDDDEA